MKTESEAAVRLAWTRMLGLPDGAFTDPIGGLVTRQSDEVIMFVRLWQHAVLTGPIEVLEQLREEPRNELAEGSRLAGLSRPWGGRLLGQATLAYRDDHFIVDEAASSAAAADLAAVLKLEKKCSASDVAEVGLGEMSRTMVLLDQLGEPTGGAGYEVWEERVAHLGVLTPPSVRRQGFGQLAAGLAANDALDRGLVPQWRSRTENRASRSTAARLGFVEVGSQTTVLLASASK